MSWDPEQVGRLLQALVPSAGLVRVERVTPFVGGWSTDTARVQATCDRRDGPSELDVVVRCVPADGLLAPYDIEREYRILRALQGSAVPVPNVIGCDAAGECLGAPCLVTTYVPGEPLSFFGQSTAAHDPRFPAYYATLATIHALDWRALGLEFLDEAEDPVEAELRRDEARLAYHGCLGPQEHAMLGWLRDHKPPDMQKAFIHGDPNPANYLFAGARVVAVLDWELALVGDPRIDFGFFAAIQTAFGGAWQLRVPALLEGYAVARPDARLQHLDYFEALGLFRLAGFLHAAKRLRGMDVSGLWLRLRARFEEIASGRGKFAAAPMSGAEGE